MVKTRRVSLPHAIRVKLANKKNEKKTDKHQKNHQKQLSDE